MEELGSVFSQWIVLYTDYFNFQFSSLHTFYKPDYIKTNSSTKVKSYFSFKIDKLPDKYSTLDMHGV